jgi:chromate transporter
MVNEINFGALRLLAPVWGTVDWASLLIAAGAFIAMFRYQQSMLRVLGGSALAGLLYYLIFLG